MQILNFRPTWAPFFVVFLSFSNMVLAREFPVPEFFNLHIVADQMQFNGVAMSVSGFSTTKPRPAIEAFYRQKWRDKIRVVEVEGLHVISHLDEGLLYTVQFTSPNDDGGVIDGFISLSNLPTVSKQNKIEFGQGFATPSGTDVLNDMISNDGGKRTRMLWLHNRLSVAANVGFYKRNLESDGWLTTFVNDSERQVGGLVVRKGKTEMNVTVKRDNGTTQILVIETGAE